MSGHYSINVHGGMLCLKLRDGLEIISEEDERKDYQMDLCSYDSRVEHHRGCLWDAEDL